MAHPDQEFDLFDVLAFVIRHAWRVSVWGVLFGVAGIGLALWLPNQYRAEAQLILSLEGRASPGRAMLGKMLGANLPLGLSDSYDPELFRCMVRSRSMLDFLIDEFQLDKVLGQATPDATRRKVEKQLSAQVEEGVIRIAYQDVDPERAAQVCNATIERLQRVFVTMQTSKAHKRRKFLEARLQDVGTELRVAEENLRSEQSRLSAVSPEDQVRATVQVAGQILSRLYEEEASQGVLGLSNSGSSAELMVSKARIAKLREQLQLLDGTQSAEITPTATMPTAAALPMAVVPTVKLTLMRLARRVKVLEEVFAMLTGEYESTRIDEVDNESRLTVLDEAVVPKQKHWPPRTLLVLAFAMTGALVGMGHCYLRDWAARLSEETPERVRGLSKSLGKLSLLVGLKPGD